MKKILGSLLFAIALIAAPYKIDIDKKEAFVKEPIFLRLIYFEPNKEEIIWVKFAPQKSQDYRVILLKKSSIEEGFVREYLLYALKPGDLRIPLDLIVKRATKQELQNDVLGTGYEQTKILEGETTKIPIEPIELKIRQTPKADLYGRFHIRLDIDKTEAKLYEPVYATLKLTGIGYDKLPSLDIKTNKNVKILKDKPIFTIKYDKEGAHLSYTLTYALISDKSYAIEPIQLKVFDYKKVQTLSTPKVEIAVKKGTIVIDKTDNPPKIEPVFKRFKAVLLYIGFFLSGVITGVMLLILLIRKYKTKIRILLAKDAKELLRLIAPYPKLQEIRRELDDAIAQNRKIGLFAIKKKILKDLP